jgi:hypothetical protein
MNLFGLANLKPGEGDFHSSLKNVYKIYEKIFLIVKIIFNIV